MKYLLSLEIEAMLPRDSINPSLFSRIPDF